MKTTKPLLTISLLISNRPDTIPRCLDSLRPIMERIPSELILIDTSKSDEIHQMLLTYTNQVYKFEWCNDFAKARNEGVGRARGEWFLYLDDDEWFEDIEMLVAFFETKEYKNFGSVNMQIRNYSNPEYTKYSDSWVTRLFCLKGGVRFEGKVHEYIYNLKGTQLFLPELIYHSGYIYDTEEKKKKHFERNAKLLLELIEKEPNGLRWQAQMVQEYYTIDDWKSIVEFCQERIKNVKQIEHYMDRNHFCTLYAGLADAFIHLERYEEFLSLCEQAIKDERVTEVLKAYLYLRKAENYVNVADDLDEAKESLKQYFKCYQNYQTNELAMRDQMGALLINRTFEKNYVDTAYNILIYIKLRGGDMTALDECVERIESEEGLAISVKLGNYLVELMTTMEECSEFERIVSKAVEDEAVCKIFCAEAQRWEEKDEKTFLKIAHIYAKVEAEFWFMRYCRVIDAAARNNKMELEVALDAMLQSMPNMFYLPDKAYEIIDKYDIKVALLWDKIAVDNWQSLIKEFVENCNMECINKVYNLIRDVYDEDEWRALSLEMAVTEKQLVAGPEENILEYYELLKQYASLKLAHYSSCDNTGHLKETPIDVKAANKIKEYVDLETCDKILALAKIKEAAEIYPILAEGLGKFVHRYIELEEERDKKQSDEMYLLRNQVIFQVRSMMKNEQLVAAMQILQQLKQMFPMDTEIDQLAHDIQQMSEN